MSWRVARSVVLILLVAMGLVAARSNARADGLTGRVNVAIQGLSLEDLGAIVVYLSPEIDGPVLPTRAAPTIAIRQHGARFEPDFVAVSVGQKITMPNDDIIYHNVFSYSEPNDFDLGLYASGETHSIRFAHPGLVRIYCSIHEAMDGLIFVSPSVLYDVADEVGRYSISEIPTGRYRIHVWSEALPEMVTSVETRSGEIGKLDLEFKIARR